MLNIFKKAATPQYVRTVQTEKNGVVKLVHSLKNRTHAQMLILLSVEKTRRPANSTLNSEDWWLYVAEMTSGRITVVLLVKRSRRNLKTYQVIICLHVEDCLSAYMPACLLTCLPTFMPSFLSIFQPAYLSACMSFSPVCLHAFTYLVAVYVISWMKIENELRNF